MKFWAAVWLHKDNDFIHLYFSDFIWERHLMQYTHLLCLFSLSLFFIFLFHSYSGGRFCSLPLYFIVQFVLNVVLFLFNIHIKHKKPNQLRCRTCLKFSIKDEPEYQQLLHQFVLVDFQLQVPDFWLCGTTFKPFDP